VTERNQTFSEAAMPTNPVNAPPPSRADVVKLVGDLDDAVITAILGTGASYLEIEEAVKWATGDAEQLGKEGYGLSTAAASVHDILMADPSYEPEVDH
jgi:hypothetical protein